MINIALCDIHEHVSTNSTVVMYVDMYSRGPWFESRNVLLKISKLLVTF